MAFRASCVLSIAALMHLAAFGRLGAQSQAPTVSRVVDDTVVILTNGQRWIPHLNRIHYFGMLPNTEGAPFAVLGGWDCNECDDGPYLFLLHPGDTLPAILTTNYPGPHYELGADYPYGVAHMYLGACLSPTISVLVNFWHSDTVAAGLTDTVSITTPRSDSLLYASQPLTPRIRATVQSAVRAGRCRELKP